MVINLSIVNRVTAAGGTILLASGIWPGYAGGFVPCLAVPAIALLGLAWAFGIVAGPRGEARGARRPLTLRQVLAAPVIVCLTFGLLLFYVPRRIAFAACRAEFESHLASAPVSEYQGAELGSRLGIYRVDRYAADPRGGVYFRTGTTADWIDTVSHGFVYRPNRRGTPFGAAGYIVRPLGGGWYWFSASNDWY